MVILGFFNSIFNRATPKKESADDQWERATGAKTSADRAYEKATGAKRASEVKHKKPAKTKAKQPAQPPGFWEDQNQRVNRAMDAMNYNPMSGHTGSKKKRGNGGYEPPGMGGFF